jgi:hypothetical protein
MWLAVGASMAGCAAPGQIPVGGGGPGVDNDLGATETPDLADAPDLRSTEPVDLAGVDLGKPTADLAGKPVDLSGVPQDLLSVPDLLVAPDMTPTTTCTPPVAGSPCDTAPQCGCTGGLACSVTNTTTGATGCVGVGTTPVGGACTGTGAGQCQAGYTCVDGVCSKYCQNASDCGSGSYHECGQVTNGSGTNIPGFMTCNILCNPINPSDTSAPYQGCAAGDGCLPSSTGASSCLAPTKSTAKNGDDCGTGDQTLCAPGYVCLGQNIVVTTVYSCFKMCRKAMGNTDCTSLNSGGTTYTCTSFGTKEYGGAVEIGYCN